MALAGPGVDGPGFIRTGVACAPAAGGVALVVSWLPFSRACWAFTPGLDVLRVHLSLNEVLISFFSVQATTVGGALYPANSTLVVRAPSPRCQAQNCLPFSPHVPLA